MRTKAQIDAAIAEALAAHNRAIAKRIELQARMHRDPGPQKGELTDEQFNSLYNAHEIMGDDVLVSVHREFAGLDYDETPADASRRQLAASDGSDPESDAWAADDLMIREAFGQ